MPNRLSTWLRRQSKRGDGSRQATNAPPTTPLLPTPRPRPLTAVDDNLEEDTSPFFRLLPYDIRRQILVAAFGERTLHLDLRLEPPLNPSAPTRARRHANAQLLHPHQRGGSMGQRTWIWWGSACHRAVPGWRSAPPGTRMREEEPVNDRCHAVQGFGPGYCEGVGCFVGAIGWLRAGRRAYAEGVGVLYGTNCFHVPSAMLTRWLPSLILPQRLGAIRALELVWTLRWDDAEGWEGSLGDLGLLLNVTQAPDVGPEEYRALLARLPEVFPNLSWLYLSLQGELDRSVDRSSWPVEDLPRAMETLLEPVDAMIARLGRLSECRVALPSTFYEARKMRDKGRGIGWRRGDDPEPEALWRALPLGGTDGAAMSHAGVDGYWIVHGKEDLTAPMLSECV